MTESEVPKDLRAKETYFKIDDGKEAGLPPFYIRVLGGRGLVIEGWDREQERWIENASLIDYVLGETTSGISRITVAEAPGT